MKIQKINWAGIKVIIANKTILIDAVEDFSYYKRVIGNSLEPTLPFSDCILFMHLHLKHFDIGLIKKCLKTDGNHESIYRRMILTFIPIKWGN